MLSLSGMPSRPTCQESSRSIVHLNSGLQCSLLLEHRRKGLHLFLWSPSHSYLIQIILNRQYWGTRFSLSRSYFLSNATPISKVSEEKSNPKWSTMDSQLLWPNAWAWKTKTALASQNTFTWAWLMVAEETRPANREMAPWAGISVGAAVKH